MVFALVSSGRNSRSRAQTSIFSTGNYFFWSRWLLRPAWKPAVLSQESSARIPQPRFLSQESSARIPQPENLSQESSARNPQPAVSSQSVWCLRWSHLYIYYVFSSHLWDNETHCCYFNEDHQYCLDGDPGALVLAYIETWERPGPPHFCTYLVQIMARKQSSRKRKHLCFHCLR